MYLVPCIHSTSNDPYTSGSQTDNPGPWFLHCHIDWHLEAGFAVVFAEGINGTSAANPVPGKTLAALRNIYEFKSYQFAAAWNQLCPLYDALSPGDT